MRSLVGERGTIRRWWFWIGLITVGGTVARIAYILIWRQDFIYGTLPTGEPLITRVWGDGYVYHEQANLLLEGKGIIAPLPYYIHGVLQQAADHPPGYIFYLAIWSALGIKSDLAHMLLSAPLGALTALTFGLVARRVWSPRAGIVAALIGAFNPALLHFPGFLLSEALSLPLIAATILWLYKYWDRPSWKAAAWVGVFCGMAVLSHPSAALIVPAGIIPFVLLARGLDFKRKFLALCAAGVTCAAFVLPWVGHNLYRYEKTVTLSVGLDYSMAQGSCDQSYYGDLIGYYWLPCMGERLEGTDLALKDQSLGAEKMREGTLEYIKDNLGQTPLVVAARVGRTLGTFRPIQQASLEHVTEGREPWLANASVLTWYPLAVAALIGLFLMRRRRRPVLPIVVTAVAAISGAAITLAVLRYRAGAEPAIAVLAGVTVDQFIGWIQRAWRDDVEVAA